MGIEQCARVREYVPGAKMYACVACGRSGHHMTYNLIYGEMFHGSSRFTIVLAMVCCSCSDVNVLGIALQKFDLHSGLLVLHPWMCPGTKIWKRLTVMYKVRLVILDQLSQTTRVRPFCRQIVENMVLV